MKRRKSTRSGFDLAVGSLGVRVFGDALTIKSKLCYKHNKNNKRTVGLGLDEFRANEKPKTLSRIYFRYSCNIETK